MGWAVLATMSYDAHDWPEGMVVVMDGDGSCATFNKGNALAGRLELASPSHFECAARSHACLLALW